MSWRPLLSSSCIVVVDIKDDVRAGGCACVSVLDDHLDAVQFPHRRYVQKCILDELADLRHVVHQTRALEGLSTVELLVLVLAILIGLVVTVRAEILIEILDAKDQEWMRKVSQQRLQPLDLLPASLHQSQASFTNVNVCARAASVRLDFVGVNQLAAPCAPSARPSGKHALRVYGCRRLRQSVHPENGQRLVDVRLLDLLDHAFHLLHPLLSRFSFSSSSFRRASASLRSSFAPDLLPHLGILLLLAQDSLLAPSGPAPPAPFARPAPFAPAPPAPFAPAPPPPRRPSRRADTLLRRMDDLLESLQNTVVFVFRLASFLLHELNALGQSFLLMVQFP